MNVRTRRVVTIGGGIALLVAGSLLVVRKKMQIAAAPVPTSRPIPVRVETARLGALSGSRTYLGRVEPWRVSELAGQITARVRRIVPREGETVRTGDLLVELDDGEIRSALGGAEVTLDALRKTVRYLEGEDERDRMLAEEGAIPRALADATADRLNEARGRFRAQQKRREEIGARLAYTRIESPYDGVVSRRLADPGDLASPGKTLLIVEDLERFKVAFDVPQEDLDGVRVGSRIEVHDGDDTVDLTISRRYPTLNADGTLRMEADVGPEEGLTAGTYHPVEVVREKLEDAVLIPEVCLITAPDGATAVFTVTDEVTRARPVEVRLIRGGLAAVSGIEPGDRVVRSTYLGWNRLAAGERVEVLP